MVDGRTCKNPKVVGIESIDIFIINSYKVSLKNADIADVNFISENTIAVKTMNGEIALYSNCTYTVQSKDCQIMKERYFPD